MELDRKDGIPLSFRGPSFSAARESAVFIVDVDNEEETAAKKSCDVKTIGFGTKEDDVVRSAGY